MMIRKLILCVGALSLLCGCDKDGDAPPAVAAAVKFDNFCTIEGLGTPLRATTVIVDSSAVRSAEPDKFRELNPELMALVMGLGDPERAIDAGAMAPRERLTIASGDPRSGTVKQVFSGCVPGVSQDELKARKTAGEDGTWSKYFGSDLNSTLKTSREAFLKQVVLSLVQLKASPGAVSGAFEDSAFARIIRGIGPNSDSSKRTIRRLFLFTNASRSLPPFETYQAAREAGFAASDRLSIDLGQSDIYIVPTGSPVDDNGKAFLDAFLLRSKADLKRVAGFSADGLLPPAATVRSYAGSLPLSRDVSSPMEIRLATTASGELVSSWISYSGTQGLRATPISGRFDCFDDEQCTLRGDPNGGLGQRWRTEPGSAPQALEGGPFGGMRIIEANDRGGRLAGRIFDPIIYIGEKGDLRFEAKRVN